MCVCLKGLAAVQNTTPTSNPAIRHPCCGALPASSRPGPNQPKGNLDIRKEQARRNDPEQIFRDLITGPANRPQAVRKFLERAYQMMIDIDQGKRSREIVRNVLLREWSPVGSFLGRGKTNDVVQAIQFGTSVSGKSAVNHFFNGLAPDVLFRYRDMRRSVKESRDNDLHFTADAMEHWLSGSGTPLKVDPKYVRRQHKILVAEGENRGKFERLFVGKQKVSRPDLLIHRDITRLRDGETITKSDYFDQRFTTGRVAQVWVAKPRFPALRDDFEFTAFQSHLKSRGQFNFTRRGDKVFVKGFALHIWDDDFDFDPGKIAEIPDESGTGWKYVDQWVLASPLVKAGLGAPFRFDARWKQDVSGELSIVGKNVKIVAMKWGPAKPLESGIVPANHDK